MSLSVDNSLGDESTIIPPLQSSNLVALLFDYLDWQGNDTARFRRFVRFPFEK
jgi:hypothetical protein